MLTPSERERYDRQIMIGEMGPERSRSPREISRDGRCSSTYWKYSGYGGDQVSRRDWQTADQSVTPL